MTQTRKCVLDFNLFFDKPTDLGTLFPVPGLVTQAIIVFKELLVFIRNTNFFPDLFELQIEISNFEGLPRGNIDGQNHSVEFRPLGKKRGKRKCPRLELSMESHVMILI
jgi:hypothetical protein